MITSGGEGRARANELRCYSSSPIPSTEFVSHTAHGRAPRHTRVDLVERNCRCPSLGDRGVTGIRVDDAPRITAYQVVARQLAFTERIGYLFRRARTEESMDLSLSKDDAAFQRRVRRWLARNIPRPVRKADPAA